MAQWTPSEDEQLRKLVNEYGPKRWSVIASKLKTKGSKQCRRRWKNHLNADLKSGGWTPEEDRILMDGHRLYGNKWTEIAKMVGGRTDNAVKNRFAALCKRDSRIAQRAPVAGRGRRGRKPRPSDSDGGVSDEEPEEDSDAYEVDDAKRSSSPSSESRDVSPARGGKGRGASRQSDSAGSSPPAGTAAPASAPSGSSAGRASVLGRRKQPGAGSPPLQSEPEAAAAPKRRALVGASGLPARAGSSGGGGVEKPQLLTPPPLAPVRALNPPEKRQAGPAVDSNLQQQLTPESSEESEELLVTGQGYGDDLPQQQRDRADSSTGGFAQPKKLPLTINIPNAASAEPATQPPPTTSTPAHGIEIRVFKDLLSPCEIQYVRELNDMQLPLHINLDDDPGAFQARPGARGAPTCEPPLTTSRQAAQNALAALASPSSSADFNDVLKWFQTGLTPRSTCGDDTPRLMGRLGFTPHGLSGLSGMGGLGSNVRGGRDGEDIAAGMLGTGLTPRCLLVGSSPLGRGDVLTPSTSMPDSLTATPSRRLRRQIAVAAAVAAAASAGPGPGSTAEAGGLQEPLSQGGGSLGSALAGLGGGLGTPAGMEMHAGHRQLLAKLIQSAAGVDPVASGDAGGGAACGSSGGTGCGDPSSRFGGRGLRVVPPSPLDDGAPGNAAGGDDAGTLSHGVVVTPYFTQQELLMLLEVLNSDDLQALPPPPDGQQQ